METIGDRIRKRREALKLSQEELADLLGYKSRSSINKIEKDGRELRQNKILDIAKALNTTPAYIMGWDEPEKENPLFKVEYKKEIPILGRIAAGVPITAIENIERYDNVEDDSLDYGLIVKGDSMAPLIREDSVIYVTKDVDYENGDIVIALINGDDATVKRFYRYGDKIHLRPENSAYKEQEYDIKEVELLGKVQSVRFDL